MLRKLGGEEFTAFGSCRAVVPAPLFAAAFPQPASGFVDVWPACALTVPTGMSRAGGSGATIAGALAAGWVHQAWWEGRELPDLLGR